MRWITIPLILATLLLAVDLTTDLDRTLTRYVYDAHSAGFPLRTSYWLDVVMHHWTKYAVITLGCIAVAGLLLSFALPALRPWRRILLFLALAIALAPLSVTAGKAASARHCPWDIDEFGGLVPYARMFEPTPPSVKPGHCFPAGHASTGFALMAFYFAAHVLGMRRAASAALATGIAAGLILGAGRVLQGAHFASHVAWSGLLCWAVMVVLYALIFRVADRRPSAVPAAVRLGQPESA
ncbi:MAG: phosphoesterase [Betaproteobacteria bacterium]|nr:phosphoesterase [Betaproteobacteria bacterium]